jgi:hypothetical protein
MRPRLLAGVVLLLSACSAPWQIPGEAGPASAPWPDPVGTVVLQRAQVNEVPLDVGIVQFDPGIPEDPASHTAAEIFPRLREIEAAYMPVLLRHMLEQSGAWGAVRVLPRSTPAVDLQVTGRIVHADGEQLLLDIRAEDSAGRVWLQRNYRDLSTADDFPVAAEDEPFADLYRQVANDLLALQQDLSGQTVRQLRQLSVLRYAAGLSPEAFAAYLQVDASGVYRVRRLPAAGDPMLARVDRIRNKEHLFIDTVDEQYLDLQQAMAPTYHLWRQYRREQAIFSEGYEHRASERQRAGRSGSFIAMQQAYDAYRLSRIYEQDLHDLALGFDNEVKPTVMEMDGRVYRLSGSLQRQYREWREILRRIFKLETGLSLRGALEGAAQHELSYGTDTEAEYPIHGQG